MKNVELLTKLLIKKSYSTNELLKSGLVVNSKKGYIDIYYNRIMFPLYNLIGQVVGFSGRIYDSSDTSKYINTKETEIFKKELEEGKTLNDIKYEDMDKLESEAAIKEAGKLRIEGKEYIVQDGDIMHFRFNV